MDQMGFLEDFGREFPQSDVIIIHNAGKDDEARRGARAIIQGKSGQFNVDTPIYEGDTVELSDPRGGTRSLYVAEVTVTDVGHHPGAFADMGHISVKWGKPPEPRHEPAPQTVIHIKGGSNQLAWGNRDVTQLQSNAWPDDLETTLQRILAELDTRELPEADAELIRESTAEALAAATSGAPDKARRRPLATLKGVLLEIASGAAAGAGKGAVAWAQDAISALTGSA